MKDKNEFKIEVSRVCEATSKEGTDVNITEEMLMDIADSYDPEVSASPFVIGHPKTEDPAFGWAAAMEYDKDTQKLYAIGDSDKIDDGFKQMVEDGKYKKVSLSMYPPTAKNNPKPGHWYSKHQGCLGGNAPAVSGLKPMSFSEDPEVLEFSYAIEHQIPSIFQSIREWLIEKFSKAVADQVIPLWEIKSIEESGRFERERNSETKAVESQSFSENDGEVTMTEEEIAAMQKANEKLLAENAAKDATISKFKADASAKRAASVKEFCDGMVENKKMMPDTAKKLGEVLTALDTSEPQAFEFSDGGSQPSVADALMEVVTESVEYSFDFSEKGQPSGGEPEINFSTPKGMTIDLTRAKQLSKAEAIAKEQGIELVDAIAQVEKAS